MAEKETKVKIDYPYAGGKPLSYYLKQAIPDWAPATEKTAKIFGALFVITIVLSLLQIPFGNLFNRESLETQINVGIPFPFLSFSLSEPNANPFLPIGLVWDLLIWLAISYILDVGITQAIKKSREALKQRQITRPVVFKDRKY